MRRGLGNLLAWTGLGLLTWGAYLAFPRHPGEEPGPGLRVIVVDASASAVRSRPGWGAAVREVVRLEERTAADAGEEFAVVLAGRDVIRLRERDYGAGVGWLDTAVEHGSFGAGTELDSAITSVESELLDGSRASASLIIVGDGEWTGADPRPRLARLARAGVACSRVGVGAPRWPDLGVLDVRLPSAVTSGEPLAAVCEIVYRPGEVQVSAELFVACEDSSGRREVTLALALPADGGAWDVSVDLGPCADGEVVVDARVRLVGAGALSAGDPIAENDEAGGRTRSGGALLGLATSTPARRKELEAWLSASGGVGVQWKVVRPEEVGRELSGRDLLISYDVSTASLPEEWLGPFLEQGGGWLAVGGWGLLSEYWPQGVSSSAPSSDWLPLTPAQSNEPEREVIFCVDGSGSMAGEPFESVRGALVDLVRASLPSDQLQMRFFTSALGPVVEIGGGDRGDRVEGLRELLDAQVPGGSTDILSSMETLAKAREVSEVQGLVLLLSDGRDDSSFQVTERSAEIRRSLEDSRTRLSVIGIGREADVELLGRLAGEGAEVVVVEELEKLADLFCREVARERVRDGDPMRVTSIGGAGVADLEAMTRAWEVRSEWPMVERLARMEARVGAQVLLRSDEDMPLLGLGRVGEGWAAVFPSLPTEGWAGGYQDAPDVWAPLWRFLGRRVSDEGGEPRLDVHGEELVLSLGDEGGAWPAIVRVELSGLEVDGRERALGEATLSLDQGVVPGVLGRRVGILGHLQSGGGERLLAHLSDAESGEELAVLSLERPLAAEFRSVSGVTLGLGSLSDGVSSNKRGGRAIPDPRAPLVVGVAMALLALSALFGRWRGGWGEDAYNNSQSAFRPPG